MTHQSSTLPPGLPLPPTSAGRTRPRWGLSLGVALAVSVLWIAGLIAIDAYGQHDQAQPAEVIIVLGAQVFPGGQPGPSLTRRTHHAVELYQRGLAPYLLCSGGLGTYPPAEAAAACDLAHQLGVPAAALLTETQSHSTEESVLNTQSILQAHGWTRAIIVTDSYHLWRATTLYRRAGVTSYGSPAPSLGEPLDARDLFLKENRELLAFGWYAIKTLLGLRWTQTPF